MAIAERHHKAGAAYEMHTIGWMDANGLRPINSHPFYDWTDTVLDNLSADEFRDNRVYRELVSLVERVAINEALASELPPPRNDFATRGSYGQNMRSWRDRTRRHWRKVDELREELRDRLSDAAELGQGFVARLLRDPEHRAILTRGDI